jgi:protein O-mannosyl-transferase
MKPERRNSPANERSALTGRSALLQIPFLVACLAVLLLLFWSYRDHYKNPFHFDDAHTIVNNTAIRDLGNLPLFLTDAATSSSLPANQAWRPGVTTLNAIDTALSGGIPDPWYFHVSIFMAYVLLGIFLFFTTLFILRKAIPGSNLSHWFALGGTAWFWVHTANAETINYIIARSDSFSTLMILVAFWMYFYFATARKYFLFLIPVVLGFLVKEPTIMFAPLLLVYTWLFDSPDKKRTKWLHVGASFAVAIILYFISRAMTPPNWKPGGGEWYYYLATQAFVIVHYFNSFFVPTNLSVDTDWQLVTSFTDDRVVAGAFIIGTLLLLAWFASRKNETKPVAFGILWFFIALIPTSSVFAFAEVLNDHRPFFPYIGLMIAVAGGIHYFISSGKFVAAWITAMLISILTGFFYVTIHDFSAQSIAFSSCFLLIAAVLIFVAYFSEGISGSLTRSAFAVVAVFILVSHALGTVQRVHVWSSGETLWKDATEKSPGNGRAWMNYGLAIQDKDLAGAVACYTETLRLYPYYSYGHINMAIAKARLGDNVSAEEHFKNAIRFDSLNPEGYYFYSSFLVNNQRPQEALYYLTLGKKISPMHDGINVLLSSVQGGGFIDQLQSARDAVKQNPTADNYIALSLALYNAEDFYGSAAAAEQAAKINPDYGTAWNNICAAYNRTGDFDKAEAAGQKAVTLQPDDERSKNNLAYAVISGKKIKQEEEDAIKKNDVNVWIALSLQWYNAGYFYKSMYACEQALKLSPNNSTAWNNLCAAANRVKEWDKAIEAGEKAVALDPALELAKNNLAEAKRGKASQ